MKFTLIFHNFILKAYLNNLFCCCSCFSCFNCFCLAVFIHGFSLFVTLKCCSNKMPHVWHQWFFTVDKQRLPPPLHPFCYLILRADVWRLQLFFIYRNNVFIFICSLFPFSWFMPCIWGDVFPVFPLRISSTNESANVNDSAVLPSAVEILFIKLFTLAAYC